MTHDPATGTDRSTVAGTSPEDLAGRRRAAVLAGYRGDLARIRAALDDPAPTVRAAGLGALARAGALEPRHVERALSDADPLVRRRAVELAGPGALTPVLDDPDPLVVEAACWALGEQGDPAATAGLCRLAVAHDDPRVRESAVAALGAITAEGPDQSEDALAAVVRAASDRPAVRRRAAVALSAFVGPEVEATLETLATDRDWQVRQVAEEILGR